MSPGVFSFYSRGAIRQVSTQVIPDRSDTQTSLPCTDMNPYNEKNSLYIITYYLLTAAQPVRQARWTDSKMFVVSLMSATCNNIYFKTVN